MATTKNESTGHPMTNCTHSWKTWSFNSLPIQVTCLLPNNGEVLYGKARIVECLERDKILSLDRIGFFSRKSLGYAVSGAFSLVQSSAKKYTMSYSKKRRLNIAPLPHEDEACIDDRDEAIAREPSHPEGETLVADEDRYGGVIIDENNLPLDVNYFVSSLKASLSKWRKQGKKGVWLKLPISYAKLVPAAIEEGFRYHHAERTHVMLAYWIPESFCTLPPNASHQVGVGGFVVNDKSEVLVVQEKSGPFRGKGVWKIPTGVILQVDTEFIELVGFRHSHHVAFEKSDLFFLCILRPLSSDIVVQELEIDQAKWMPIDEFMAQPFYEEHANLKKMLDICVASSKKIYTGFSADISSLPTVSYYNIADMS